MKILKFSGIVAAIHLLVVSIALTNPGCSSSSKPAPSASETEAKIEPSPMSAAPMASTGTGDSSGSASSAPAPIAFNPNGVTERYSPTRPGTPVATSLQTEPVANVTAAAPYTVVSGDSLSVIAKKNHATVADIAAANNLNPTTAKLRPGQKLIIPVKGAPPAKTADAASAPATPSGSAAKPDATVSKTSTESITHKVEAGETLGAIARMYGVKQSDIAVANSISDPKKLPAGKVLIIPGWQSVGKNAKPASTSAAKHTSDAKPASPPANVTESVIQPAPAPAPEVPVIKIEDTPSTAKP